MKKLRLSAASLAASGLGQFMLEAGGRRTNYSLYGETLEGNKLIGG